MEAKKSQKKTKVKLLEEIPTGKKAAESSQQQQTQSKATIDELTNLIKDKLTELENTHEDVIPQTSTPQSVSHQAKESLELH